MGRCAAFNVEPSPAAVAWLDLTASPRVAASRPTSASQPSKAIRSQDRARHWLLHGALGHVPPVEFEGAHNRQINPARQPLLGELPSTGPGAVHGGT